MTDPFVDQLADLCRQHVTRAKWVFVPAHGVGHTIGERIALGGTNWLNLRFVTPLDVALRMGAPFLVERGIEPSEEGLGPALMMRLLLALPEDNGYFRPLAEQPTLAQALWTTLRELRMAGVTSDAFAAAVSGPEERVLSAASPTSCSAPQALATGEGPPRAAGRPPPPRQRFGGQAVRGHPREVLNPLSPKHAEIRALLEAYERFLAEHNRADMAAVYEEAVKHPDWCPIQPQDCWTEMPDVIWSPLQRRLMDTLPGERIAPRALALPALTLPRRLADALVDRVAADPNTHRLAFLMTPGNAQRDRSTPER
jgi:hypothetical protein